jgi:cytochrome d ubiquinol oxidase subunit II
MWTKPTYGLEALLNPFNLAFGFMLVFLSRVQGALYFLNSIDEDAITNRIKNVVKRNFLIFLPLFLYVVATILFSKGYVYNSATKVISLESMKFLHLFLDLPLLLVVLLIGVVTLLWGVYIALFKDSNKAIFFTGIGTVLTVTIVMLILGVHNSVFYPSLADMQSSLTIENASGSYYTLSVMAVVSLLVPVVLGYIFAVWRSMDETKLTINEIKSDPHHY